MRVALVASRRAEALRQELWSRGWIDATRRTMKRGPFVAIPLTDEAPADLRSLGAEVEQTEPSAARSRPRPPADRIRERLRADNVPAEESPQRWRRIGDVVVLRLTGTARAYAATIGRVVGETLGARSVVEDASGVHGAWRSPDIRVLWGTDTETTHQEGGVRYRLDVARIMFSAGNLAERVGLEGRIPASAIVVDLFAGIGYFALPIAVKGPDRLVYACEISPLAFGFLRENIRLNRVVNVVPRLGDCRDTAPRGVADWVVMGHFDARDYLDVAFRTIRDRGTIVYHELCPKEQYPRVPLGRVADAAESSWFRVGSTRSRVVKSYSPGILHVVVEADVERDPRAGRTTPP